MASGSINYTLHSGSNLVSFPFDNFEGIDKTITGLQSLFANTASMKGIIGQGVATTYLESEQTWVGSLTTIDPVNGYWLILSGSQHDFDTNGKVFITISGSITDANYERTSTHGGMNLVSYPHIKNYTILEALDDISGSSFNQMIYEGTAASYIDGTGWVGSLSTFKTGSGYWIKNKMPGTGQSPISYWNAITSSGAPAEPSSDGTTGSWEYVKCTDGDTQAEPGDSTQGSRLAESGYGCKHTPYWKNIYGDDREIHSFGQPSRAMVNTISTLYMTDSYYGTSSVQNAAGNEISWSVANGPPMVSWHAFSDSGSISGSLMAIGTHPIFSRASREFHQGYPPINIYEDLDFQTAYVNEIPEGSSMYHYSGSYIHQAWLQYDDGQQAKAVPYPTITDGVELYPRVYDPHRNRVYSAKVYNWKNEHVRITGSSVNFGCNLMIPQSASYNNQGAGQLSGSVGGGTVNWMGFHYIKTDE
tara:strand:- start:860 stop:2281 length:1422 start_codon:yes stop_codon:yes gene_type:complete